MSVNINTVYQTTLSILNKEQRGYLTPQQFNLFANQAQLDLFEQYFYDINQFGRVSGNSTEYSDMLNILNEKISPFETVSSTLSSFGGGLVLPPDLYRLGTKPALPIWGYNIVFGEALYNASTSTDFELNPSEETELVIKILELAGIAIEDIQLYQIAAGEELKNTQQEKA